MANYKIQNSTTGGLDSKTSLDYQVTHEALDFATENGDTIHYYSDAAKYLGYYKNIPEVKQGVLSLARWTAGKGWKAEAKFMQKRLEQIRGWGEDSFDSICKNLIVMKKVVGDAFAEIMRDDKGDLINLKPISPERIAVVVNNKGMIKHYLYLQNVKNKEWEKLETNKVLHLCNDRLGDEIHGLSAISACQFVIDAKQEAQQVYRKIMRRQLSLGVLEVEEDDLSKINEMITKYQDAVDKGEVLVLPKDVAAIKDTKVSVQDFLSWIQYLDNFFYQALGVPRVILGGASEYTEASSKVGYLTFEQVYMAEQRELETDLWNQVAIKVKFDRPVSLKDNVQQNEAANTGQLGFQPNEVTAQEGRVE